MPFTFDEDSRRRVVAAVQRATELFGSPRPILDAMGLETVTWISETFRDGGRPAWEPLKPRTLAGRRLGEGAKVSTGTPLDNQGKLRKSFDIKLLTDTRVEIGTDVSYARFHEFGTKGPYPIRPRFAKALALPALVSGPGGGIAGQFNLEGLKRAKETGRGSFVFPGTRRFKTGLRAGQRTASGRRVEGPASRVAFNVRVPYKNVQFVREVMHPGLPARPMLPTPEQITPRLVKAATRLVEKWVARG